MNNSFGEKKSYCIALSWMGVLHNNGYVYGRGFGPGQCFHCLDGVWVLFVSLLFEVCGISQEGLLGPNPSTTVYRKVSLRS